MRRVRGILAAGVYIWGANALAQTPPAAGRPLDVLESEIGRLAKPGSVAAPDAAAASQKEAVQLQDTLERMQEELVQKSDAIRALEDENEKLRQALRLRFGGGNAGLPPVPIPNRELLESVLREPAPFQERREVANDSSEAEAYTVVSEWGRSPEVAKSLPGAVASLIGLAIAVEPGTPEAELKRLGEELRQNYEAYDNINIEIFDEVGAARRFADQGKSDPGHRVMSISKFKHSGRDSVVVYRDGRPVASP